MQEGKLYVVATPIGNLNDITYRAVTILQSVDIILAEDPRTTEILCKHFNIVKAKVWRYNENVHVAQYSKIFQQLMDGKQMAIVSDGGTPAVSDPGGFLLHKLRSDGFKNISPLPGCCSAVAAISVSGSLSKKFIFLGFLPNNEVQQRKELSKLSGIDCDIIIFERGDRLHKVANAIVETIGDRKVMIAREISKVYEEFIEIDAVELNDLFNAWNRSEAPLCKDFVALNAMDRWRENKMRGEVVIVVHADHSAKNRSNIQEDYKIQVANDMRTLMQSDRMSVREVVDFMERYQNTFSRREIYDIALNIKEDITSKL